MEDSHKRESQAKQQIKKLKLEVSNLTDATHSLRSQLNEFLEQNEQLGEMLEQIKNEVRFHVEVMLMFSERRTGAADGRQVEGTQQGERTTVQSTEENREKSQGNFGRSRQGRRWIGGIGEKEQRIGGKSAKSRRKERPPEH